MKLKFYKQAGEPNRIDKSKYLNEIGEIENVLMTEGSDLVSPSFIIQTKDIAYQGNYVYCDFTHRYYFVNQVIAMSGGRLKLQCTCDVLFTYHNEILESKAWVRSGKMDDTDGSNFLHNDLPFRQDYIIKGINFTNVSPFTEINSLSDRNVLLIIK